MDTEQLRLIIDVLSTLGDNGKSAFIWWLVLDKGLPVFAWLVVFFGVLAFFLKALRLLNNIDRFKELRDVLGVGSPGAMLEHEVTETLKRAIALARKNV